MKGEEFLAMIFVLSLFLISIMFNLNHYTGIGLFICILASMLLVIGVKRIVGNFTNMSLFFVIFSMLYGLSGPISALWGEGLPPIFSKPYSTDVYLIIYSLANIGLIFGLVYYHLIYYNKKEFNFYLERQSFKPTLYNAKFLVVNSIFLSIIGTVFEVINFVRVGGFSTLLQGKAVYQSAVSSLTFTLPSTNIMYLATSLMGLYLGICYIQKENNYISKNKTMLFFLSILPFILINLFLGRRGVLITLFLCFFVGITYFKPIKKLKPKLIILFLMMYIFMGFIYTNRGIAPLLIEDRSLFFEMAFKSERIIQGLIPASNEFGSTFGNFSEFYKKYNENFIPKLGESYIEGLVNPIPTFVYPGGIKPKAITYEFRDEFFPSEATRGSIASTGFSSLLEAYINFKYLGVFLVYSFIGYFLQKIDFYYRYKSFFSVLLYITTFSLTMIFHRSSFGFIFGNFFLSMILVWMFTIYFKIFSKREQG